MTLSTHFIVDYDSTNADLFWKHHEKFFQQHLSPLAVSITTPSLSVQEILVQAIHDGWKKIILIGNSQSVFYAVNTVMEVTEDIRKTLSLGFWPFTPIEAYSSFLNPSANLLPALQIIKAGHTLLSDLVKVVYVTNQTHTCYFWKNCCVSAPNSDITITLRIDEHQFREANPTQYKLQFHEDRLHSFSINPADLKNTQKLHFSSSLGTLEWIKTIPLGLTSSKENFHRKNNKLEAGQNIGIWSPQASLDLRIVETIKNVKEVQFEIQRRVLPLIVPVAPARTTETAKESLLALKKGVIATKSPPSVARRSGALNK